MQVKTVNVETYDDLIKQLLSYKSGWIFRGHTKADWKLESSLERVLAPMSWRPELAIDCEKYSINEFKTKAHHYMAENLHQSPTTLGWLALMQHHGVPTRLLDFTQSPFFALFFAFREVPPNQQDCCSIWALNYREIMKYSIGILRKDITGFSYDYSQALFETDSIFEKYLANGNHDVLWITEPLHHNIRLERQKGTFVLSGDVRNRILDVIENNMPPNTVEKLNIPATLARGVFKLLNSMGVDSTRLFADLDGLGSDIKNMMLNQLTFRYLSRGES